MGNPALKDKMILEKDKNGIFTFKIWGENGYIPVYNIKKVDLILFLHEFSTTFMGVELTSAERYELCQIIKKQGIYENRNMVTKWVV